VSSHWSTQRRRVFNALQSIIQRSNLSNTSLKNILGINATLQFSSSPRQSNRQNQNDEKQEQKDEEVVERPCACCLIVSCRT
ncbi:hypothetical protein BSL78_25984, partial [Apostichopus japonicus]